MKSNLTVSAEPFVESNTLTNIVDFVSSYVKNTPERKDKDELIEWGKFIRLSEYGEFRSDSVGLLIGRSNCVQLYRLEKGSSTLHQLFSLQLPGGQTGTLLSSKNKFGYILLVRGVGCHVEFSGITSSTFDKTTHPNNIVLGATITRLESNNKMLVILLSSGSISVVNCASFTVIWTTQGSSFSLYRNWLAWADINWISEKKSNVRSDSNRNISTNTTVTNYSQESSKLFAAAASLFSSSTSSKTTPRSFSSPAPKAVSIVAFSNDYQNDESPTWISHFRPKYSSDLILDQVHLAPHAAQPILLVSLTSLPHETIGNTHDLLVYRISPYLASEKDVCTKTDVTLLYKLHRGDTPANFYGITISYDCRLVLAESTHGTVHVWPLSPHGGAPSARIMCEAGMHNRFSVQQRSAGLAEDKSVVNLVSLAKLYPHGNSSVDPILRYREICDMYIPGWFECSKLSRLESLLLLLPSGVLLQYEINIKSLGENEDCEQLEITNPSARRWFLPHNNLNSIFAEIIETKAPNTQINNLNGNEIPTPGQWYSNIEVNSQYLSTKSSIRKLDRFQISTYQSKDSESSAELLVTTTPTSPSRPVTGPVQIPNTTLSQQSPSYNSYSPSSSSYTSFQQSSHHPHHQLTTNHQFEISNSYCGSSVGSIGLAGHPSYGSSNLQMNSNQPDLPLLHNALQDYFDEHQPPSGNSRRNSSSEDEDKDEELKHACGGRNHRKIRYRNRERITAVTSSVTQPITTTTTTSSSMNFGNHTIGFDDDDFEDYDDSEVVQQLRQRISSGGSYSWNDS